MLVRVYRHVVWSLCVLLAGCAVNPYLSEHSSGSGILSDDTMLRHADSAKLEASRGLLITGNDRAFLSKLELVKNARATLDLMYFIYADDHSSSVLSEALIAAARRGVKVRLLVDYHTNYARLDLFSLMQREGGAGPDSLEVRFYNRPTREIVMDAAYLTLGCDRSDPAVSTVACSVEKQRTIAAAFADEVIESQPAAELNISNLSVANSGLFLSGLYSKNPKLMAQAVLSGQPIDVSEVSRGSLRMTPETRKGLLELAQLEWQRRTGDPLERLEAQFKLALATQLHGETINPIREAIRDFLPVARLDDASAVRDWEYLTDFLHHKLLLADNARMQIGGRNIEDSYHMRPNPLVKKYIFMDTDLQLDLHGSGLDLRGTFDRLWDFRAMVASLDEVRQHAPNELAVNIAAFEGAAQYCANVAGAPAREQCVAGEFARRGDDLRAREDAALESMRRHADQYWSSYRPAGDSDSAPSIGVDATALLAYVENLPLAGGPTALEASRSYGARDGAEARSGKRIHGLWLAALEHVCRQASPQSPRRIVLHNAYFAPPANLIERFGEMVSGEIPCAGVTVTVLTNSEQTTDLVPVNLVARHILKAFAEFSAQRHDPARGARFEYYEYVPPVGATAGQATESLHSKVAILGDDLLVGSANADLRSYLMDSNNAMFIRNAPNLLNGYQRWVDGLLADPRRTRNQTDFFVTTSHEQIVTEDRQALRAIVARYGAERWLAPAQIQFAEDSIIALLRRVHALTLGILAGDQAQAAEYNRAFKGI
ncbi:MAG: hypothetical protein ACFCUJ_13060 [Thiotrichales bacterium]